MTQARHEQALHGGGKPPGERTREKGATLQVGRECHRNLGRRGAAPTDRPRRSPGENTARREFSRPAAGTGSWPEMREDIWAFSVNIRHAHPCRVLGCVHENTHATSLEDVNKTPQRHYP